MAAGWNSEAWQILQGEEGWQGQCCQRSMSLTPNLMLHVLLVPSEVAAIVLPQGCVGTLPNQVSRVSPAAKRARVLLVVSSQECLPICVHHHTSDMISVNLGAAG